MTIGSGGRRGGRLYPWAEVDGFGQKADGFGQNSSVLFLRHGCRRIDLPRLSPNEAEWLEQQLNDACNEVAGAGP